MRNSVRNFCICLFLFTFLIAVGVVPAQQQSGKDLSWAFLVADKNLPPDDTSGTLKHVPGSSKAYTMVQIDDLANPPDWFPDEHPAPPNVVLHGEGSVLACGSCHLMSGLGHPESADLAGLPATYIERELTDFKSGDRKDPANRMNGFSKGLSDDEIKQVSEWFAALKPAPWVKVVEADTVPKTWINKGRMRLPIPGGGTEPLGDRIIELPQDPARVDTRDPHSGFVAYVPFGSLAKGEKLAATGEAGKTIQCAICHGEGLTGLGDVPKIAGLSAVYITRQLYGFKNGVRDGNSAALMKGVVAKLSDDDIIALAAYVASQKP